MATRKGRARGPIRNPCGGAKKGKFGQGVPKGTKPTHYSRLQVIQQESYVSRLLLHNCGAKAIVRRSAEELGYPLRQARVVKLIARITEEWAQAEAVNRANLKLRAVERLYRDLDRCRKHVIANPSASMQNAISRVEELIAKIEGTEAPVEIKIDVRHTEAVMMVLGTMDPEEMKEMLAEQKRLEEQAARALPELTMVTEDRKSTFGTRTA